MVVGLVSTTNKICYKVLIKIQTISSRSALQPRSSTTQTGHQYTPSILKLWSCANLPAPTFSEILAPVSQKILAAVRDSPWTTTDTMRSIEHDINVRENVRSLRKRRPESAVQIASGRRSRSSHSLCLSAISSVSTAGGRSPVCLLDDHPVLRCRLRYGSVRPCNCECILESSEHRWKSEEHLTQCVHLVSCHALRRDVSKPGREVRSGPDRYRLWLRRYDTLIGREDDGRWFIWSRAANVEQRAIRSLRYEPGRWMSRHLNVVSCRIRLKRAVVKIIC